MELVDRLHEQRLVVPGRPVQRVQRHAAVQPAGRVPGVQGVGQRGQEVLRYAGRLAGQRDVCRAVLVGKVGGGQAADQVVGQLAGTQRLQERPGVVDQADAHLVGDDLPIEQPRLRSGYLHRLGEQVVQLDHLDAPLAEPADEVSVVPLGVLHPHHVVEQQVLGIGRGQPTVRQPGRADQNLAQGTDLRVHTVAHLVTFPLRSGTSAAVGPAAVCYRRSGRPPSPPPSSPVRRCFRW